jgi:hypothetical protein
MATGHVPDENSNGLVKEGPVETPALSIFSPRANRFPGWLFWLEAVKIEL